MVPMGREGLAGRDKPPDFSDLEDMYVREIDLRETPFDRRTQSRIPRRTSLQGELFVILSEMQRSENGIYRGEAGLRAFEEALQYAIPRRVDAFIHRFRQNGQLSFLKESTARIEPMKESLRALALLTALTNVGGQYIRPEYGSGKERFGVALEAGLYFALRRKRLTAIRVRDANGTRNDTKVIKGLNKALSKVYENVEQNAQPPQYPALMNLGAGIAMIRVFRSYQNETGNLVVGFVFGSANEQIIDIPKRVTAKTRASYKKEGRQPSLTQPELQHLISPKPIAYKPRTDIIKFTNVTPLALAKWLRGAPDKRRKPTGRKLARRNPQQPDLSAYEHLRPGEYEEIPALPDKCVYRTADNVLKVTSCKRAATWAALSTAYKLKDLPQGEEITIKDLPQGEEITLKENPMASKKFGSSSSPRSSSLSSSSSSRSRSGSMLSSGSTRDSYITESIAAPSGSGIVTIGSKRGGGSRNVPSLSTSRTPKRAAPSRRRRKVASKRRAPSRAPSRAPVPARGAGVPRCRVRSSCRADRRVQPAARPAQDQAEPQLCSSHPLR